MTSQKLRRKENDKFIKFDVDSTNAHKILEKLCEKLEASELGVICNGDDSSMTIREYAFWMRKPVAEVEKIFCQEVINDLMKFVKRDPM